MNMYPALTSWKAFVRCHAIQPGPRDFPGRCAKEVNHDGRHESYATSGMQPTYWSEDGSDQAAE